MRFLEKHRTFFLYRSPSGSYDPDSTPIAFEMGEDAMMRLKKLWESYQKKPQAGEVIQNSNSEAGKQLEEMGEK